MGRRKLNITKRTYNLKTELYDKLCDFCKKNTKTQSSVINEALEEYLNPYRKKIKHDADLRKILDIWKINYNPVTKKYEYLTLNGEKIEIKESEDIWFFKYDEAQYDFDPKEHVIKRHCKDGSLLGFQGNKRNH